MKVLVFVENIDKIPPKIRTSVLVISQGNWTEVYEYLSNKTDNVYLFLSSDCPSDRLLKLIEDYSGSLVVYTASPVSNVFLSRFTRVVNRVPVSIKKDFGAKSHIEQNLEKLKQVVRT